MCAFRTPWEGGSLQSGTSREWSWKGMCAYAHTCTYIHKPNIHRWRAGLFLSMGRNLPPLMQVVGASGAQEYWDLRAFSGQGALLA